MNDDPAPKTARAGVGAWFDWSVEHALGVVFITFTVLSFGQVVARYVFGHPITWTEEICRYLFVWVVFVGAGVAERSRGHITLDFLTTRLPPNVRRRLDMVNGILCVGMVLLLFVWYGWSLTVVSMRQQSPFGGPPVGFAALAIPVGGLLMILNIIRARLEERPPERKA